MKLWLSLIFLLFCSGLSAKTCYVSTTGKDSYPGTYTQPWLTWNYAFKQLDAGDTLYIRGGTYKVTTMVQITSTNKGTESNPICVFAYPDDYAAGNVPILDCDGIYRTSGMWVHDTEYWIIKGLTICHAKQDGQENDMKGFVVSRGKQIHLIDMVSHDNGGPGFMVEGAGTIVYYKNCDAYNNCDSFAIAPSKPGGAADGFQVIGNIDSDTSNWVKVNYKGCRSWNNSDDGFGNGYGSKVELDSCWSLQNGHQFNGDGRGITVGIMLFDPPSQQHVIRNCLSAFNKSQGFRINCNGDPTLVEGRWFNNTAAFNGEWGFRGNYGSLTGSRVIFRNNIAYDHAYKISWNLDSEYSMETGMGDIYDHNSWDISGLTLSNADFLSIDSTGISGPRKADGSLPDIDFMKLAPSSDCIDAGINVGISYYGTAPDLGYSEYHSTPPSPVYVSSVIQNASPDQLEIMYNITLANIVPASSAFTVKVNSVTRTVSSIAILGTKIVLTLSVPVVYGDVVTVAYTKPTANPVQTSAGGQAVSLTAQNVTNNVGAVPPVYVSSVIENATPARLEMIYNVNLATILPAASSFTVMVNSVARTVSSVAISGTKVLLTLASPVVYGDVVTVAYTKPSTNPLQTSAGGQAVSLTAQNVTNNVGPVVPVYISSVIENVTPSRLEMVYNITLANIIPPASAFTVVVNSVVRIVSSVSVSGTKVLLTLASPVVYGDVVTVAYTQPGTNPVQTPSGGEAISLGAQPVTNKVNPPVPAYVSSVIENAAPARLEMTYDLSLANIIPALSAFTVRVNGTVRTISSITISGTKVILNLSGAVVYGDLVTVAYTKPATSPLQTPQGGQAITISARNVTNNVAPIVPVYQSSLIESATPSNLEMTFSVNLANIVPDISAFTVNVNSVIVPVTAVSVSGTKVILTLAGPVVYGDIVTVGYTKPAVNPLQTPPGIPADSYTNQPVSNLVGAVIPLYISSVIENATPTNLEMTYDISLTNIIPAVSAFTVRVNSVTRAVSSVTVSGTRVILTMASPISYGDLVTVAYTRPGTNPLQTLQGGQAVTMTAQPVTNNVEPKINQPPVVDIFSPASNSSFFSTDTIIIEVYAYDPDGMLSRVELFNGSNKLYESTSELFAFEWIDVPDGIYTLAAVATDESGAQTTSSVITVIVKNNQYPFVNIITPVNDTAFQTPAIISITSDAVDPDGAISKVEYFNGDMKIGESTAQPYRIQMDCSRAGTYEITAKATDNLNASSVSPVLVLYAASYQENRDSVYIYPNPNDGHFSMVLPSSVLREAGNVSIINIAGETIYSGLLNREEYFRYFDISHTSAGTYILVLTSGNKILSTKKLIKK